MEQNRILKEEIRKLERDRSRETENLEYLKNVVVHYMSADSSGRDQLLMPLATILHLSPEEVCQYLSFCVNNIISNTITPCPCTYRLCVLCSLSLPHAWHVLSHTSSLIHHILYSSYCTVLLAQTCD